MSRFDYPGINVEENSNETNMQIVKGYLMGIVDDMNYYFGQMENRIVTLEQRVKELEGNNGE